MQNDNSNAVPANDVIKSSHANGRTQDQGFYIGILVEAISLKR